MQGGADVFGAIFTPNIPSQISNPRNVLDLEKMPKIDTQDALEEHEEHEDDYQTNSNW